MKKASKSGAQPEVPRHRSSKDTQRWCKGRVGKRHLCRWQPEHNSWTRVLRGYPERLVLRCINPGCNKPVLEIPCETHYWSEGAPFHSTHDWRSRPAFYGPGLPPSRWYRRDAAKSFPDYVDLA